MFLDYACARFMQFLCPKCAPSPSPRSVVSSSGAVLFATLVHRRFCSSLHCMYTLWTTALKAYGALCLHMPCQSEALYCNSFICQTFSSLCCCVCGCSDTSSQSTTHLAASSLLSLSLHYLVHPVKHNLLQGLVCTSCTIE